MNKVLFMKLLDFPSEWIEFYPDELFALQKEEYEPGCEAASEHMRYGAFNWWLSKSPEKPLLEDLVRLSLLDPDPGMAADVRHHICQQRACDEELYKKINNIDGDG